MKYRITSNGRLFKAEYSKWGIFWNNIKHFNKYEGSYSYFCKSIEEAEEAIAIHKEQTKMQQKRKHDYMWTEIKRV
jgi:hypothetical protein